MSNEKNRCSCGESDEKCPVHGDDVQSAERAQRKLNRINKPECTCGISVSADCAVHGRHAARRFPISKPLLERAKLINDSRKYQQATVTQLRHPATDLVTALKLLKEVATPAARQVLDRHDWQAWSERVENLLKQFPNLK